VGNFPGLWTEWNGKYRDTVRDYWRGEPAALGEFAAGVAPVADVAIGDGAEFDVVAEFGPFDGGAAGFVFGIVGVGSENDDAEFAVGFGGLED
jgi:hypothetical protein